jgi:DNA-directed RNA polymerase subunit M/transcription elongation factor TFIIS
MKFCQLCGSLMKLENKRYVCSCGNFEYANESKTLEKNNTPKKELQILQSEINPLASHDHICSKCGFDKAQVASRGISVSDEDEMFEYVCGKCGHHDPEDGQKA